MRYYECLRAPLAVLAACLQAWGGTAPRIGYRVETVAGSALNGDQGAATAAQISNIQGLASDRSGNLYLSDTDCHRIRRVAPNGIITTIAGTGIAGFSGDGGPANLAQLNLPYGLATDLNGNLYIADLGNQRVRRVSPDGTITTVAGDGRKTSSPDGGLAAQSSLFSPRNLTVDDGGALYISEFEGHRVRKVTADGRIATVAGTGQAGFRGDGGAAIGAQLSYPAGLAADHAGALYIADSGNNRIRKVYASGAIGTVLGGSSSTLLGGPIAVAVDASGGIYVADSNFVVRVFTAAGKWIDYAGNAMPGFSGDGGPATKAALNGVHDLLAGPNGGIYLADGVRVRVVDFTGVIRTVAGDGYARAVGDGLPATSAILYQPSAIALDSSGNLYIADTGTQRVRQVLPGGTMTTLAGTGTAAVGSEGAAASASPLNFPMGVAVDVFGNILIADTNNHRIRQVSGDRKIRTIAGTGASGAGNDGAPALATALRGPRAVCTDRAANLYITDTGNHRVLRAPPGGLVATVAGNGSPGDGGDGGNAQMAQLNQPFGCALDSFGNLYVADTFNHRIRKVSAAGTISTVAGQTAGMNGDEGPAVQASLNLPVAVAVDDAGDIYIADSGNHRIRQVTPDGVIHTIAGTGAAGFSGDKGPGNSAQIHTPGGLYLDGSGALYFADTGNNRIRRLTPDTVLPPDPITLPPPALVVVNALSLKTGPVAPGEIVSIFGAGLGPEAGVQGTLNGSGMLTTLVAGVEARFDGVPAPLFYVQDGQVNAQVPYAIAGASSTHVEMRLQQKTVSTVDLAVAPSNPALLDVVINQDGSANGEAAPAPPGSVVTLYATGEGLTDGPNISGLPASLPSPVPLLPVALTIAGIPAEVLFAGSAPGLIGVMQINARVPAGFLSPGKATVGLTVGGAIAPTLAIWLK